MAVSELLQDPPRRRCREEGPGVLRVVHTRILGELQEVGNAEVVRALIPEPAVSFFGTMIIN